MSGQECMEVQEGWENKAVPITMEGRKFQITCLCFFQLPSSDPVPGWLHS